MLSSASKYSKMCRSSLKSLHFKAKKSRLAPQRAASPWDGTTNPLNVESEQGCLKDGRKKKKSHFFREAGKLSLTWDPSHCGLKLFGTRGESHFFPLLIHKAICLFNGIRIKSSWNGFLIKIILCLSEWEHLADYKEKWQTLASLPHSLC